MDKYQKVRVLGKGSFGSAILIKRKTDNQLFVVKEVSLSKMGRKEREEARHECTVLQQLQHPNIVRYVEQFENKNNLYIVMEYCDGGDLAAKVKESRGPMKESVVMYYFSQICLAMEYLHARHILHRDIKTMNVFLMKNGAVKLGDFGISTVLRNTMGMANTVCGTPYYFSPELCRNRPYNNKSDIWALGVLLYECATGGRHPFDGQSMNQLMQRIVRGSYSPLSSQYSPEFRKMVDWCLQKEPAKRPSIKQTLALPVVRGSLENLEENLLLATQCRVRLKDIIDFQPAVENDGRRPSSPAKQVSPQASPRSPALGGMSPGQAAAMALAKQSPGITPLSSPSAAVVGPKPGGRSAAVPHQANLNAKPQAVNQYLRRPSAAPSPSAAHLTPSPQPSPSPTAEKTPRSNVNLSSPRAMAAGHAVEGGTPRTGGLGGFDADMQRVDAIMARYGRHVDEKARETIHAYMRRRQEEYLKRQKEELDRRERMNEARHQELRRAMELQRAGQSPGSPSAAVPRSPSAVSLQHRPKSGEATPRARTPSASRSPSRAGSPRVRAGAVQPSAFGRDPRKGASPAGAAAAAAAGRPLSPAPARKVVYAANSPQYLQRPSTPEAVRPTQVEARRPLTKQGGRMGETPRNAGGVSGGKRSPSKVGGKARKAASPLKRRKSSDQAPGARVPQPAAADAERAAKEVAPQQHRDGISKDPRSQQQNRGGQQRRPSTLSPLKDPNALKAKPPWVSGAREEGSSASLVPRLPETPPPADRISPPSNARHPSVPALNAKDVNESDALAFDHGSPRLFADPRYHRNSKAQQGLLKPLSPVALPSPQGSPTPTHALQKLKAVLPDVNCTGHDHNIPSTSHNTPVVSTPQAKKWSHQGGSSTTQVEVAMAEKAHLAGPSGAVSARQSGPVEEALRVLHRNRSGAVSPSSQVSKSSEVERPVEAAMHRDVSEGPLSKEEAAAPNTLDALRNLRNKADKGEDSAPGKDNNEYLTDQLALLKQRQRLQQHHQKLSGAEGSDSSAEASRPREGQSFTDQVSPRSPSGAQVRALSLGNWNYGPQPQKANPSSNAISSPRTPSSSAVEGTSPSAAAANRGSSDGYAEMLQHLKNLLQLRRVARGGSRASGVSTASPPLPSPMSPNLGGGLSKTDGSSNEAAPRSPPHLKYTRPLGGHSQPADGLSLASQTDEDDDDDFEDAVPLSPVRCTEKNDSQKAVHPLSKQVADRVSELGSRPSMGNVYSDDVDLTSSRMEEELEGEEGYTGYYKLPSPRELMNQL